MHPDSARELKAHLVARLAETPPATTSGAPPDQSGRGGTWWAPPALGLALVGPDQVHLAIRLADRDDAETLLSGLDDTALAEVDVRVIGRVRALAPTGSGAGDAAGVGAGADEFAPGRLQQRTRPLRPGLSLAHPGVTAGTLGGFVRWQGQLAVLSNNHVIAASDAAIVGDAVLQPGPADGGRTGDRVATLAAYPRLSDGRTNLVDAAVATLDAGADARPDRYPGGALAGQVVDLLEIDPEELVEKVGRTTGHTRGRITAVEVDGVSVQYDEAVYTFDDQVEVEGMAEPFSAGGDSGSVIWRSRDRTPLGLLFAGSASGGGAGGGLTFANPLATVLTTLGVEWVSS